MLGNRDLYRRFPFGESCQGFGRTPKDPKRQSLCRAANLDLNAVDRWAAKTSAEECSASAERLGVAMVVVPATMAIRV